MRKIKYLSAVGLLGWMFASSLWASGDAVHMAVSPSIKGPMGRLCELFSQKTSYECKITSAPTGHLYAHVMHGVAYDLFVSSDEVYTQGLMNAQKADEEGNFVVAIGRVVLWSADPQATPESLQRALMTQSEPVAMANPGVTPYGGAAKEILQGYALWNGIQNRLIFTKNMQQAYDMVANSQAKLGFVSLAQLSTSARAMKHYWEPDPNTYKPVVHEVIMLKDRQHEAATMAFVDFLHNEEACEIIQEAGFRCSNQTRLNA